jgi:hypothetical protein
MFKGLRTAIYQVSDLQEAKSWYTRVLGTPPYFDQPFYAGFSVGGYELGLQPDAPAKAAVENIVAYWGVDDAQAALDHLPHSAPSPRKRSRRSARASKWQQSTTRSATCSELSKTRTSPQNKHPRTSRARTMREAPPIPGMRTVRGKLL